MKLYKYRGLSKPDDAEFWRLHTLLHRRAFWCARPDTLNDPAEFAWTCDFTTTANTVDLLTDLLIRVVGRAPDEARHRATSSVKAGRLKVLAEPIIATMIHQCRDEIGVACFGSSPDNETLWERYASRGAGVCIELDVPENLLGAHLFPVQYSDVRRIHIDQLVRAFLDPSRVAEVYALALLSKRSSWAPEAEIRFISRLPAVGVVIDGSLITRLILGDALTSDVADRIERMAAAIPVVSRGERLNIGLQPTAAGGIMSRRG